MELRKKADSEIIIQKRAKYATEIFDVKTSKQNLDPIFYNADTKFDYKLQLAYQMLVKMPSDENLTFGLIEFLRKSLEKEEQAEKIIRMGFIEKLAEFLDHTNEKIKNEALWILLIWQQVKLKMCLFYGN